MTDLLVALGYIAFMELGQAGRAAGNFKRRIPAYLQLD